MQAVAWVMQREEATSFKHPRQSSEGSDAGQLAPGHAATQALQTQDLSDS